MKKTTLLTLTVMAFMALIAYPAFASDEAKSTGASTVSGKSLCASDDKAEKTTETKATLTGAKGKTCSLADPSSCTTEAKSANATETVGDGAYAVKTMSVKGMTCVGCENTISAALMQVPGVVEVVSIDHKTGEAIVKVDPVKAVDSELTMAVVNKGYEAEIIAAVAKSTDTKAAGMVCPATGTKVSCMKSCTTDETSATQKKTLDDTK